MHTSSSSSGKIHKVTPVRIFEQAVEQIRDLIGSGELAPGQKLPTEQQLGKLLNVSRSSVREALRVLEAEGLIEAKRGSGTFVTTTPGARLTRRDAARWLEQRGETLEQVLQVRESIEGLAAALAASRATDPMLTSIRAIFDQQKHYVEQIGAGEPHEFDLLAQLDVAFHLAIGEAGGNDLANEIISRILPAFNETNKAILYASGRMSRMLDEHRSILDALEAHNAPAAEKAMRDHLSRVRTEILELKSSGGAE